MGTKNKNRLLSLILVLAMVFSMTPPVSVAATGTDSTEAPASTEATDATDPVEASEGAVAQIGDATYETLAGAIAAAETGATIQLLDSIDLGSEYVTIDKELTLDLCGKTITSAALYALYITGSVILTDSSETAGTIQDMSASSVAPVYGAGGSSITVEKVNIVSYYDAYAGIYTCGNLTVNSGDIFGWAGIYANGATVTVNGGTIHGYNCGINDCYGSTVTVNGGTVCYDSSTYAAAASGINVIGNNTDLTTLIVNDGANILGYGFGIATNGSTSYGYTSITINGGTVSAVNGGMYLPAANSTTTITGGEISGYCGIGISNGTLNISGGNITGTAEDSGLDDSYTGSGLNMDGSAIVLAASYGNVTVNISGGTIKSDYSYAIRAYYRSDATAELTTQVTIAGGTLTSGAGMTSDIYIPDGTSYENVTIGATITGGTFSGDVSAYVAVGYTQDENGNVVTDYAAQIGETKYASLADAIDAAKSGDTVVLLKDVTLSETVNIYKSITLDLGNYTITSTADGKAIYTTQALTITAGSGGIDALGCAVMNQKGNGTGALTINGGTYTSSTASAIYNIKGTVTIESGTIQSTAGSKDGICCAENGTDGSAVVIVNGGTIVGTRYGVYSTYNVQISGGEITGTKVGLWIEDGTAEISGGTITGYEGLKSNSTSATITISDGTFVGETHGVYAYNDTVTVSGGTFTATGTKAQYAVAFYIDGATVTFSGGTFSGMYSTVWIKSGSSGSYKIETGYVVDTGSLTDSNSSDTEPQVRSVVQGVACIGDTYYASIDAAVAAANAATSGVTITLLVDIALDSAALFTNTNVVTLNLNGKSITRADGNTTSYLIGVASGASLTVQDSGNGGSIDGSTFTIDDKTYVGYGILTSGSATVISGTVTGYRGVCVNGSSASLTVNGGTVSGTQYGVYQISGSTTVNGGTVSGSTRGISASAGTVAVSSGTVECTGSDSSCIGIFMNNGTVTVSDGTVKCAGGSAIKIQGGTLTVSGGTVDASSGSSTNGITAIGYNDVVEVNLTGGTVKSTYIGAYVWENQCAATVNVSGSAAVEASAELDGGWIYGIYLTAGAVANIEGGSVSAANSSESGFSAGIVYIGNGDATEATTVNISGGSICGGTYGLSGNGSTSYSEVNISGGSISSDVVAIYHPEMGSLTITGGSITGVTSGVQLIGGSLSVAGGSITATATAAEIEDDVNNVVTKTGDGAIADGAAISIINRSGYGNTQSGGSVSFDGVTITGGTITSASGVDAVQAYDYNSSTGSSTISEEAVALISISGGRFSSVVADAYCAEGYTAETEPDVDGYYTVSNTYVAVAYTSALSDGAYYSTFDEVVAAIDAGAITDGMTIKLLGDATWTLTANKKITIGLTFDLNGKTLTMDGSKYVYFAPASSTSTVTFTDSSYTDGELTGKVVGAYKSTSYGMIRFNNACNVVLENVLFENSSYGYVMEIGASSGVDIQLTATNCSFINSNTADKYSSKIWSQGVLLYGNSASATGTISFENCTFQTSDAGENGAALKICQGKSSTVSPIAIDGCTIVNNGTTTSCAALQFGTSLNSKVTVTNSTMTAATGYAVDVYYDITSTADITLGEGNIVNGVVYIRNGGTRNYTVNVTGGRFDNGEDAPIVAASDTSSSTSILNLLNLTGGYFKTDVSDLVANGYACVANTEEAAGGAYNSAYADAGYTYTVVVVNGATDYYILDSSNEKHYFDSLSAALASTDYPGGTVYFAADCTLTADDIANINTYGWTVHNYGGATLTCEDTLSSLVSTLTAGNVEVTTLTYKYDGSTAHTISNVSITDGVLVSGTLSGIDCTDADNWAYYTTGILSEGYVYYLTGSTYTIESEDSVNAQAKIDDILYCRLLSKAVTTAVALNNSDTTVHTVTMLQNVTTSIQLSGGNKLVLDMNGKTLTGYVYVNGTTSDGGEFTIKNGTINQTKNTNFVIYTNGTLTNVTLTLDNLTVTHTGSTGIAVYLAAGGTTTITDCTISGATGIVARSSDISITDTTVTATGEYSEYDNTYSGGAQSTGDAIILIASGYPGGAPNVSAFSGVTAYSANGKAVVLETYYTVDEQSEDYFTTTQFISDGYYSSDVSEYCVDGFKCITLAEPVSGCDYSVTVEVSDFYGASLLFKDIIQIRYYFQIDGYDAGNVTAAGLVVWEIGDYDADAELTLENCSYCTTDGLTANGNYYYATSEGIPAKNMGDSQYVRYYYTTEDGQTHYSATTVKYSPRIYAENKLAQYGEDSDLGKLAIALLNYGTAAQVYFAYDVENPMNASLTDSQKAWEYDSSVLDGYPVTETLSLSDATSNDDITKYGWSTVLKGALVLNLYCKIPSELLENATKKGIIYWNGSDYSGAESLSVLDYTGKTDTLTANGNYYYGSITRIAAKNMGDTYYACVYVIDSDGNTTYSNVYVYSVYNYASNKIASGSETLQDLCKSLVIYGEAAKAYFTSQQS